MNADVVQIYRDAAGEWRWRRRAANGRVVSVSGEGYTSRRDAFRAADRVNGLDIAIELEPEDADGREGATPDDTGDAG